jgi:hypothetical protein
VKGFNLHSSLGIAEIKSHEYVYSEMSFCTLMRTCVQTELHNYSTATQTAIVVLAD